MLIGMILKYASNQGRANSVTDASQHTKKSSKCFRVPRIDHINNNRHFGFDIIMQISHVVCQGANIKMMLFLRKSAGLNSEVSAPKSHLRAKM